jgi:hypothetical protein
MLFDRDSRFPGLPREGFEVFRIPDHEERRLAILDVIHPSLKLLAEDLLALLNPHATDPLHAHLPQLNWPRGYRPFCTWLALSREAHGYQAGPQLNLGIHADHVSVRLGWDTSADDFGRFEFLCRHGDLGRELIEAAGQHSLAFRVFAAAPWPQGSKLAFESPLELPESFDEVRRRGVWWELGRNHRVPEALDHVCSPDLGRETGEVFGALLPIYERIAGTRA